MKVLTRNAWFVSSSICFIFFAFFLLPYNCLFTIDLCVWKIAIPFFNLIKQQFEWKWELINSIDWDYRFKKTALFPGFFFNLFVFLHLT